MIIISAFRSVPAFVHGLVKDLRVRWALEEAGLAYEARLIGPDDQKSADYRARQPFGQVPCIDIDGVRMFESGAIVLHIAQRSEALMPADPQGRARTASWVFAALNSIEPSVQNLGDVDLFFSGEAWAAERRPGAVKDVNRRLDDLEAWLDGRDYLEGRFTAGDLMMTTVLRNLRQTDIVAQRPVLQAYKDRCEARPAFRKALADHLAPFKAQAA